MALNKEGYQKLLNTMFNSTVIHMDAKHRSIVIRWNSCTKELMIKQMKLVEGIRFDKTPAAKDGFRE